MDLDYLLAWGIYVDCVDVYIDQISFSVVAYSSMNACLHALTS